MTNTELLLMNYIITKGIDEEGAGVVFELTCGCMVAVNEDEVTATDLIACSKHDINDIDNDDKTDDEVLADFDFAGITTDVVKTLDARINGTTTEAAPVTTIVADESIDIMDYAVEFEETTNEKDEETMTKTVVTLKATRKKVAIKLPMVTVTGEGNVVDYADVTGYKVENNAELELMVYKNDAGVWGTTEMTSGALVRTGSTIKESVETAEQAINAIGVDAFNNKVQESINDIARYEAEANAQTETVNDQLTLDDLLGDELIKETTTAPVADDAPMVDDEATDVDAEKAHYDSLEAPPVEEEEEVVVAEQPADAVALAQELLDLIAKGTNFSTLMQAVRTNATAIVNGTVAKPEPKKVEETPKQQQQSKAPTQQEAPKKQQQQTKADGASEASAFEKFKSAHIVSYTANTVTFNADGVEYIFLKNEAGRTLIRKVGSNSNSYMSVGFLQSLVYNINTQQSRALFRRIKTVDASKVQAQGAGAASGASAKEKPNATKNNPSQVMNVLGTEIPRAWFNDYVKNEAMKTKHGKLHLHATTIKAEFLAEK